MSRPALVGRVSEAIEHGGLLLVAAAGYGKTSALQETLAARPGPSVWLSCAASGGDAGLLLVALVERLREAVPGSVDVIAERISATLQRVDVLALARTLRSELEQLVVDPVVVVFDDAEALERWPDAVELVEILLHSDPRVVKVAVATRRPLKLRIAKLVAAGRVAELGVRELAFSAEECAGALARRRGRAPTSEEVDAVMASTEGWPLGVGLSAGGGGHTGASPRAGRDALFSFLDEEVLGGLDDELRRGVLDAAIAPDLTEPLLAALGLPADFRVRAQQAGLAVRPVAHRPERWSFHPLVREFLRDRVTAERTEAQRSELHARVAGALAASGRQREAVEHWLDAGDWRAALGAAVGLGYRLQRVSPAMTRSWLARLPPAAWDEPAPQLVRRPAGAERRAP